jgi:hypothetical protein
MRYSAGHRGKGKVEILDNMTNVIETISLVDAIKLRNDLTRTIDEMKDTAPDESLPKIEYVDGATITKTNASPNTIRLGIGTHVFEMTKLIAAEIGRTLVQQTEPKEVDPITRLVKQSVPTVLEVGRFVDKIARNNRRNPQRIAQRALEEMVEVCFSTGLEVGQIYASVSDAIHNQCLKQSAFWSRTVFPSQFRDRYDPNEVQKEVADLRLVLLDLLYTCGLSEHNVRVKMSEKFEALTSHGPEDFATDNHTFYLKKPHVNAPATTGK